MVVDNGITWFDATHQDVQAWHSFIDRLDIKEKKLTGPNGGVWLEWRYHDTRVYSLEYPGEVWPDAMRGSTSMGWSLMEALLVVSTSYVMWLEKGYFPTSLKYMWVPPAAEGIAITIIRAESFARACIEVEMKLMTLGEGKGNHISGDFKIV